MERKMGRREKRGKEREGGRGVQVGEGGEAETMRDHKRGGGGSGVILRR